MFWPVIPDGVGDDRKRRVALCGSVVFPRKRESRNRGRRADQVFRSITERTASSNVLWE